ncbi:MAG TPA: helix-turn-helix domain-containing protein [Parafilimonas sp.]|nr:helix-turn-helix domain-containing protein [Parafilimonas sp.]
MICKRILPAVELRGFIREYMLMYYNFDCRLEMMPPRAYPVNPEEAIRFLIKGKLWAENPAVGTKQQLPVISIIGQPTYRLNLFISPEYLMLYVRFQPGMLFKLLKIPMTMLLDQHIDASCILGTEINEVYEQMGECTSYDGMLQIINNYFIKKFNRLKNDSRPIDVTGKLILQNPQAFNLEKTAREACLSNRQFEKRFEQLIGITPKYFARICRFYQAYVLKESHLELDWLSIAVQTGYHDYQHLVKDFKTFAGTTPNILIDQCLNNPLQRLAYSAGFRGC